MSRRDANPDRRILPSGQQGPLYPGGRRGYYYADRQSGAVERECARAMRTAAEQLRVLDERLGYGVGAKRERARLAGGGR